MTKQGDYSTMMRGMNSKEVQEPSMKCQYQGCPLKADVKTGNSKTCGHHYQVDFPRQVTDAINENIKYINWYNSMVFWNRAKWVANEKTLESHPRIPMEKNEFPSNYLYRVLMWIENKIKDEATKKINSNLT